MARSQVKVGCFGNDWALRESRLDPYALIPRIAGLSEISLRSAVCNSKWRYCHNLAKLPRDHIVTVSLGNCSETIASCRDLLPVVRIFARACKRGRNYIHKTWKARGNIQSVSRNNIYQSHQINKLISKYEDSSVLKEEKYSTHTIILYTFTIDVYIIRLRKFYSDS